MRVANGVGLALEVRFKDHDQHWGPWLTDWVGEQKDNGHWEHGDQVVFEMAVALVKVDGNIAPGPLRFSNEDVGASWGTDDGGEWWGLQFNANIAAASCQIQTQNVNVPMGDVSMSTFKGVGSTSPSKEFVVKMTCPAGINKLWYQLAPAGGSSALDAKNGELSLSNSGGASGVGVQLQDWYGTPLALQEARPIPDYDPQTGGEYQITNKAVYIQTEDHVKGGEADAQAVFTLSYQ